MRFCRVFFAVVMTAICAVAAAQAADIRPQVQAKLDSIRANTYKEGSSVSAIHPFDGFREKGDATRSWPMTDRQDFMMYVANLTPEEDAVLVGSSTPMNVNREVTHGLVTINITTNESIALGRARYVNEVTGGRCVISNETIHDDIAGVYLMIVKRAPGMHSLMPGRNAVTASPPVNLQGIRDTLNQVVAAQNKQEKRITYLENNMLSKNSLGFSVSLGYCSYDINDHAFRGPTVIMTGRYYDLAIEGYVSELFKDSQEMLQSSGNDLYLRFSDNNLRGGSIFWAPAQGDVPMWGKYWQLGVTGLYGDQSNIEHIASLYTYYTGPALKVFVPMKPAIKLPIVLEAFGTVGYGWTTMSSTSYDTAPTKSQGSGFGLRGALVIGRR